MNNIRRRAVAKVALTRRRLAKLGVVAAGLVPVFGACVTTNQLQDFIRSEGVMRCRVRNASLSTVLKS